MSNARDFNHQLQKFSALLPKKIAQNKRRVALGVYKRVINKSPVGNPSKWAINKKRGKGRNGKKQPEIKPKNYVGGRFRASWTINEGSAIRAVAPEGLSEYHKPDVYLPQLSSPYTTIVISNNMPYARRLNDGHSEQAPPNFVEEAVLEEYRELESKLGV